MNFNRRSPEEFQWKIFLGEDLLALAVLAVLCHFDGKLSQPRPQGFSLRKWVGREGKSPGDEVEIVRDSPMVNIVSRTVKFMLPGNTKCSLTSLTDTKEDRFIYGASNFAAG